MQRKYPHSISRVRVSLQPNKQPNKQTNKQTNNQTNKQTTYQTYELHYTQRKRN